MRRAWIVAMLVVLVVTAIAYLEHQSDLRNKEARLFIESLIPRLQGYKSAHGRYPEAIPNKWHNDRLIPGLLRRDFFLTFDNGHEFLMRFRDPRVDPRFWWNDIVAYQSNIGHWAQWDGY